LAFSLLDHMTNATGIVVYSLVIRLLQGTASATIQTSVNCIATMEFGERD